MFILLPGPLGAPNPVDQEIQMLFVHRPKLFTTAGMDQPKLDPKASDFCSDVVRMDRQLVSHQSAVTTGQSMATRFAFRLRRLDLMHMRLLLASRAAHQQLTHEIR